MVFIANITADFLPNGLHFNRYRTVVSRLTIYFVLAVFPKIVILLQASHLLLF